MIRLLDKYRALNIIGFIILCLSIGQLTAILLTSLLHNIDTVQLLETLKGPAESDKVLIISLSFLYSLFSFLIIPVFYLLISKNKASLYFLYKRNKLQFTPFLLSIILVIVIVPVVTVLIKFNYGVEFPVWLSELEAYFKESEGRARQLTNSILSFGESEDLIIAILIMAVIPGILEELFFRGIVQTQLQDAFKNHHYAVWVAAFLFSFFHFQFYGFIPRIVLGMLFGYLFVWSKNIWYPCAAHITNNLIAVLGGYFWGPQFLMAESEKFKIPALIIPSIILTGLVVLFLKRTESEKKIRTSRPADS